MTAGRGICAIILAAGLSSRMQYAPKALCRIGGETLLGKVAQVFFSAGVNTVFVVTGHEHEAVGLEAQRLGLSVIHNDGYQSGMFSSVCEGIRGLPSYCKVALLTPVDAALARADTVRTLLDMYMASGHSQHDCPVLIPSLLQKTGHPVLIPQQYFSSILQWSGLGGLRGYFNSLSAHSLPSLSSPSPESLEDASVQREAIRSEIMGHCNSTVVLANGGTHPDGTLGGFFPKKSFMLRPVCEVAVPDEGILSDLDTPEELVAAQTFLRATRKRALPSLAEAWQFTLAALPYTEERMQAASIALAAFRLGEQLYRSRLPALPFLDKGLPFACLVTGLLHGIEMSCGDGKLIYNLTKQRGWSQAALIIERAQARPEVLLDLLMKREEPCRKGGMPMTGRRMAVNLCQYGSSQKVAVKRLSPHIKHKVIDKYVKLSFTTFEETLAATCIRLAEVYSMHGKAHLASGAHLLAPVAGRGDPPGLFEAPAIEPLARLIEKMIDPHMLTQVVATPTDQSIERELAQYINESIADSSENTLNCHS